MEETALTEELTPAPVLNDEQPIITIWNNYKRGKVAYLVLWVIMGVMLLALISDYFELQLLKGMAAGNPVSDGEASANDTRQQAFGILEIVLMLVSAVTFLNWFRRAYGNISRAGVRTEDKDKMAVWYFFIPIICFFKPPRIMHEIWDKTQFKIKHLDSNYIYQPSSYFISIWWLLYIVTNFLGRYIISIAFKEKTTVDEFIRYSQATIVADFLQILEGLALLYIIFHIRQMEIKLAAEIRKKGGTILEKP